MDVSVGLKLGNYHLVSLLGRGGFANVYLGEHIYLKTRAAIKVLGTQLYTEGQRNFLAEARTIARLDHPNIVRILDFGMEGETPFLVMNYAPYGSLRKRHPIGGLLAPSVIVTYVKQIAAALHYAHQQRIIHRDVKPENMLLDNKQTLLLSDFGLAIISHTVHSASTKSVLNPGSARTAGTTTYMAPEQFNGNACIASDQYALGVVVYEWLCGSPPFVGNDLGIAVQHMYAKPPSLAERIPDLAPAIEQVVMTALAKDPSQRFPDVQAFADALEIACAPVPSTPYLLADVSGKGAEEAAGQDLAADHLSASLPSFLEMESFLAALPASKSVPDVEATKIEENIDSFSISLTSQVFKRAPPALSTVLLPETQQTKNRARQRLGKRSWLLLITVFLCLSGIVGVSLFPSHLTVSTNTLPANKLVSGTSTSVSISTPPVAYPTPKSSGQKQSSVPNTPVIVTPQVTATTNTMLPTPTQPPVNNPTPTPVFITPTPVVFSTMMFTVTPNSFDTSNCSLVLTTYFCTATLVNKSQQSQITWNVYGFGANLDVAFSPQSGTLQPGTSQHLTISISHPACPMRAVFTINSRFDGSSVQFLNSLLWSC